MLLLDGWMSLGELRLDAFLGFGCDHDGTLAAEPANLPLDANRLRSGSSSRVPASFSAILRFTLLLTSTSGLSWIRLADANFENITTQRVLF